MSRLPALSTLALAAVLAASGCSEELGPEVIPYSSATGVVYLNGRPVDRGWVELQPLDGALGDITSARIRPDGSFHVEAAPIGQVMIRLVDVPIGMPGAIRIFRNASPIRRVVESPPGPPMTIEIVDELVLYQKRLEASR